MLVAYGYGRQPDLSSIQQNSFFTFSNMMMEPHKPAAIDIQDTCEWTPPPALIGYHPRACAFPRFPSTQHTIIHPRIALRPGTTRGRPGTTRGRTGTTRGQPGTTRGLNVQLKLFALRLVVAVFVVRDKGVKPATATRLKPSQDLHIQESHPVNTHLVTFAG